MACFVETYDIVNGRLFLKDGDGFVRYTLTLKDLVFWQDAEGNFVLVDGVTEVHLTAAQMAALGLTPEALLLLIGGQIPPSLFITYILGLQPTYYYPMNAAPGDVLIDAMGNLDLPLAVSGTPAVGYQVNAGTNPFTLTSGSIFFDGDETDSSPNSAIFRDDITVNPSTGQTVLCFARPGHLANAQTPAQPRSMMVDICADSVMNAFGSVLWSWAAGSERSVLTKTEPSGGVEHATGQFDNDEDIWHMYGSRITNVGGGNYDIDALFDGQTIATDASISINAAAWALATVKLTVGGGQFHQGFYGDLCHVMIWDSSLSDTIIGNIYTAAGGV